MTFLFIGVTLDVAQVLGFVLFLFDYLGGIDPGSWAISSLTSITFFGVLRLISSRRGMELSLFPIFRTLIAVLPLGVLFVLLRQQTVTFWAPGIDLPNVGRGL